MVSNVHIFATSFRTCWSDVVAHIKQFVGTRIAFYARPTDDAQLEARRNYGNLCFQMLPLQIYLLNLALGTTRQSQLLYVFITDQYLDRLVGSGRVWVASGTGGVVAVVDSVSSWVGSGRDLG